MPPDEESRAGTRAPETGLHRTDGLILVAAYFDTTGFSRAPIAAQIVRLIEPATPLHPPL
jgi:hypothetical protein